MSEVGVSEGCGLALGCVCPVRSGPVLSGPVLIAVQTVASALVKIIVATHKTADRRGG